MKNWNKIIMQLKLEDRVVKTAQSGNDYAILNLTFEKQIKDKTIKTFYKAFVWDEGKIEEVKRLKVGDVVLVTGTLDISNYLVDGVKLDSGKDYYKQSNNINIASIELLPIGNDERAETVETAGAVDPVQKVKQKHKAFESSLGDDLDDEIPF